MAMGIPSLILIFAVLTMGVLSLLSYGTSRSDRLSSEQSLFLTQNYYSACEKATGVYTRLAAALDSLLAGGESPDAADGTPAARLFEAALSSIRQDLPEDIGLFYEEGENSLALEVPFSSSQSLRAVFSLDESENTLSVLEWHTIVTSEWNPDTSLKVYSRETAAP